MALPTSSLERKTIALIAHDNKKQDLLEWARFNRETLSAHNLIATGTTGALLEDEIGIGFQRVRSGPLGGDQQIGALRQSRIGPLDRLGQRLDIQRMFEILGHGARSGLALFFGQRREKGIIGRGRGGTRVMRIKREKQDLLASRRNHRLHLRRG